MKGTGIAEGRRENGKGRPEPIEILRDLSSARSIRIDLNDRRAHRN